MGFISPLCFLFSSFLQKHRISKSMSPWRWPCRNHHHAGEAAHPIFAPAELVCWYPYFFRCHEHPKIRFDGSEILHYSIWYMRTIIIYHHGTLQFLCILLMEKIMHLLLGSNISMYIPSLSIVLYGFLHLRWLAGFFPSHQVAFSCSFDGRRTTSREAVGGTSERHLRSTSMQWGDSHVTPVKD